LRIPFLVSAHYDFSDADERLAHVDRNAARERTAHSLSGFHAPAHPIDGHQDLLAFADEGGSPDGLVDLAVLDEIPRSPRS
jgi:hypothetical protein